MSDPTKIVSKFTDPVPAGTVVRLQVPDPQANRVYDWFVVGPYSTSQPERFPDRGPHFDFDTSGRRPGDYDVTAVWYNPGDAVVNVAADEPDFDVDEPYGIGGGGRPDTELPKALSVTDFEREIGEGVAAKQSYQPWTVRVAPAAATATENGVLPVSLQRTSMVPTNDQVLWVIIRNRTNAISFRRYKEFADGVLGKEQLNYRGANAYELLKESTDAFLMQETGVLDDDVSDIEDLLSNPGTARRFTGEERTRLGRNLTPGEVEAMRDAYYEQLGAEKVSVLPYMSIIRDRLSELPVKDPTELPPGAYGILPSRLGGPVAMELIWSYWHEEGMLVQTLNAILARFQNRKLMNGPDPLARFDLDPLRPLSNVFWGWAQDELRRLTVRRRSFEYEHEYGLRLIGRAIPSDQPADRRSKFLEAFHNLLFLAHVFFKEDDDTTVLADGFPLLNALRETHLILAEGAHNQFGDLPSTARAEMLMMQWLLARPEMREFLGGRIMVPYEEPWMDRVDTVKQMQGWGDTSITHFRDMAAYGEQILLSVRYGNWSVVNDPQQAANWARYWRPEIQRYTHAYRSATGVDLTAGVDTQTPGFLLQRRLATGKRRA